MVNGSFNSLNFFDLPKRPQAIPHRPNKSRLRGIDLTRLNPALKRYLMYSNFPCRFLCRILAVNQGYTYSNILDLSRKISAMSIAGLPLSRRGAVYNRNMTKDVIHISEAEAASDFASLMATVRSGAEVIIENNARPVAVMRPAEPYVRLLSESLRLAREHGSTVTLDEDFARDVEAAIESHREPLNPPAWD
jgi:prevent-host-death family protein